MWKMEREEKRQSLYSTQVTHPVRAYPGFLSMKRLGLLLITINPHPPPPRWDASPSQGYPPSISSGFPDYSLVNHFYSWMERGAVKEKCFNLRTQHIDLARS